MSDDKYEVLHKKVDEICDVVHYIRGKIDTLESTNSDWWSRVIAIGAALIALLKFN